jgi:hypothetical protein
MFSPKFNILVVYWYNAPSMRVTTYDHLHCFDRHLDHRIFYVNVEHGVLPSYVTEIQFDIVVFHDLFFCGRWGGPPLFHKLCERVAFLRDAPALKIAIPQDEFISADLLCEFINSFNVNMVFSVSPESEWPKIYRDVDRQKVKFFCVLTGYLEQQTLLKIEKLERELDGHRDIGIGYRAGGRNWRQAAWLGRHGILKVEVGERVQVAASRIGIHTDISSRADDVFMGDDWYRFLLRSRHTIGVEGGASILDWDGSIRVRTLEYVERHPDASLEEIEASCFPGLDGTFALFALSPRHLEACATRTCQILIKGNYNGVLQPWIHYLPLERDFSNLDDILQVVKDDSLRTEIVKRAYDDVVASGAYTYGAFVDLIMSEVAVVAPELQPHSQGAAIDQAYREGQALHRVRNTGYGEPSAAASSGPARRRPAEIVRAFVNKLLTRASARAN